MGGAGSACGAIPSPGHDPNNAEDLAGRGDDERSPRYLIKRSLSLPARITMNNEHEADWDPRSEEVRAN